MTAPNIPAPVILATLMSETLLPELALGIKSYKAFCVDIQGTLVIVPITIQFQAMRILCSDHGGHPDQIFTFMTRLHAENRIHPFVPRQDNILIAAQAQLEKDPYRSLLSTHASYIACVDVLGKENVICAMDIGHEGEGPLRSFYM